MNSEGAKLPYPDNSFDVVYAGFIPTALTNNKDYLKELMRVSREAVLIIMSGDEGDIPAMRKTVLGVDESERRDKQRTFMEEAFEGNGWGVDLDREIMLKLDFKDENDIFGMFHCLDFKNELGPREKVILRSFLKDKVHNFKDHLYYFVAKK